MSIELKKIKEAYSRIDESNASTISQVELRKFWDSGFGTYFDTENELRKLLSQYRSVSNLPKNSTPESLSQLNSELQDISIHMKKIIELLKKV